jgi:hypothetical protein
VKPGSPPSFTHAGDRASRHEAPQARAGRPPIDQRLELRIAAARSAVEVWEQCHMRLKDGDAVLARARQNLDNLLHRNRDRLL